MLRGAALLVTLGIGATAVGAVAAPNDPAPAAPVTTYLVTPTPADGTTSTLLIQPSLQSRLLTRFPMVVVPVDPSIDPMPTSQRNPGYFPMRVVVPEGINQPALQVPNTFAVPAGPSSLLPSARPAAPGKPRPKK